MKNWSAKLKEFLKKLFFPSKGSSEERGGQEMGSFEALIAGLGNPGPKYAMTRHNIGFIVTAALTEKLGASLDKHKFEADYGLASVGGKRVVIGQPQTYMNKSGIAVRGLLNFYKIEPKNLIVVYDDIDLEPGRMLIKKGGADGGHKGIRSIMGSLGTDDFVRVRIGVGRPKRGDVSDHVLDVFGVEDDEWLGKAIEDTVAALQEIVENGLVKAQNKFHSKRRKSDSLNQEIQKEEV